MKPFIKKDGGIGLCGSCPDCRIARASDWSFRLMEQDKVSDSSLFITLTYDTKYVPITKAGFMSLDKRDLQLFFKRLRKGNQDVQRKLKYYAVGEYGGRTRRPHYHVIAFSTSISEVESAWQLGAAHFGIVTGASVGYTLKYITKNRSVPMHWNDDRVPEFSLMSKNWGCPTSQLRWCSGIRMIWETGVT